MKQPDHWRRARPIQFRVQPSKEVSDYIDRAGGFNRAADKGQVYIIKVDGSTIRPGWGLFWNAGSNQWESGSPSLSEAGDRIVVPAGLQTIAWLRNLNDWTQILYQPALGAANRLSNF